MIPELLTQGLVTLTLLSLYVGAFWGLLWVWGWFLTRKYD